MIILFLKKRIAPRFIVFFLEILGAYINRVDGGMQFENQTA